MLKRNKVSMAVDDKLMRGEKGDLENQQVYRSTYFYYPLPTNNKISKS